MVPGNAEVVDALEQFLVLARQGQVNYAAVIAGQEGGQFNAWSGGANVMKRAAPEALARLGALVEADLLNCTLPERNTSLGADYVCYNCAVAPFSFDFLPWLASAEMTRVREGAPGPLKVAFWFGRDGKTGMSNGIRQRMFEKVVRPLVSLMGAVETSNTGGRFKEFYGLGDVANGARAGEAVPRIKSPISFSDRGYVTITLRENNLYPHRNSNVAAWLKFGEYLLNKGEQVVFVRDTAKAHEPLGEPDGSTTIPMAAFELPVRAALYQAAKINLCMANGPWGLMLFMDRPWLAFNRPNDGVSYEPNSPEFWRDFHGVEYGGQFPWCRPDQRVVWANDDFDNLVMAWEDLCRSGWNSSAPPTARIS